MTNRARQRRTLVLLRHHLAEAHNLAGLGIHDHTNLISRQIVGLKNIVRAPAPQTAHVVEAVGFDLPKRPLLPGLFLRKADPAWS